MRLALGNGERQIATRPRIERALQLGQDRDVDQNPLDPCLRRPYRDPAIFRVLPADNRQADPQPGIRGESKPDSAVNLCP